MQQRRRADAAEQAKTQLTEELQRSKLRATMVLQKKDEELNARDQVCSCSVGAGMFHRNFACIATDLRMFSVRSSLDGHILFQVPVFVNVWEGGSLCSPNHPPIPLGMVWQPFVCV